MTLIYQGVACIVAVSLFLWMPRPDLLRAAYGSFIIGVLWPILWPIPLYFWLKTRVFKRPLRMDKVLELEFAICMVLGLVIVGVAGLAWWTQFAFAGTKLSGSQ